MDQDVEIEKSRLLLKQAPSSIAGGAMVALTILVIFWEPTFNVLSWFGAFLLISTLRLLIWLRDRKAESTVEIKRFHRQLNILLVTSGLIWGYGIWAVLPADNTLLLGVLIAIYSILVSGAIGALAPSSRSYLIYITPVVLSVAITLMINAPDVPAFIPLGFVLFGAICFFYTRNMERTIQESIELRSENQTLISELKNREIRLSRAAEVAEEASEEKSRFLAVASHDLLQLMHALELFMRALTKETHSARVSDLVNKAAQSTRLLSDMLSSLMDQSKLETNRVIPKLEPVATRSIIDPVIQDMRRLAAEKNLQLSVELEDAQLNTDPQLLQRILINLIGNAIKYTHEGGVRIKLTSAGEKLTLCITDTGIGIPEDELPQITKEYYQVDTRASSGLGLGLSIVHRLNQLLGYQMQITSEPGHGTQVTLIMPIETNQTAA
jgi:signal transduction histidine kinase